MFFLIKWHFLKYKYQQITLYFIKIIVNLKIFEVGVSVHLNLRVYRRSSRIKYAFSPFNVSTFGVRINQSSLQNYRLLPLICRYKHEPIFHVQAHLTVHKPIAQTSMTLQYLQITKQRKCSFIVSATHITMNHTTPRYHILSRHTIKQFPHNMNHAHLSICMNHGIPRW